MNPDVLNAWENFLNPNILRPFLINASLYITGFEVLKDAIIDRIKSFYMIGFDKSGNIASDDYKREVLSRNKSKLYASLLWLQENQVIDNDELKKFNKIKDLRNQIAHELMDIVGSNIPEVDFKQKFTDLIYLLNKIEKWWVMNLEIPTNPDMDDRNIDERAITPGSVLTMQLMMYVAVGDKNESMQFYKELMRRKKVPVRRTAFSQM